MSRNKKSKKKRKQPPRRTARRLTPADAVPLAIRLHRKGRVDDAEKLYRKLLESMPDHPDVLHFLGVLRHQAGHVAEAEALVRRALGHQPDYADAHNNLGNILRQQERLDEAESAYREAVRLVPEHADAHNNLGTVLRADGRLEEAIREYRTAISCAPEHPDSHYNLGTALWQQGKADEAADSYRRSLDHHPCNSQAYTSLGRIFYRTGRRAEAREVFERWLESDPDNAVAQHMASACSEGEAPDRASDAYLREIFDAFADSFDRNLQTLKYRAPQLIFAAVAESFGEPGKRLQVLDAGCGTGLCGALLRQYSERLVGVDLSEKMLDRAREKGNYDELVAAELTAFLRDSETPYDLIASADTLVYFGKLDLVFQAAASSLAPGGRLAFTVEQLAEENGTGFRLEPHGRYCHAEGYVRGELTAAGFTTRSIEQAALRLEGGQPVPGLVVLAELPGTA